jgi:glutamate carboxypeptidase
MSIFSEVQPRALREATLERLRRLVELESPSSDETRLRAVAAELVTQLIEVGAAVETVDVPGVGEHVIGRVPGDGAPIVILVHIDTVHPVGTFDPPFRLEDGRAYGPGAYDMKGGVACVLEALARLRARRDDGPVHPGEAFRPVTLLATCDEETGSDTSRSLIEELAREAHVALVPEPPLADGSAKTRRKGVGLYRLTVHGRASHAGLEPENGVNALLELAHQAMALTALADPDNGTTVSMTQARAGTAINVIPARAEAGIDVRFTSEAEAERVDAAIRSLEPVLDGSRLELAGGINRPPLERTEEVVALYEQARSLAAAEGWELGEGLSGGGSDGSFTSALGVPTLDGIGPLGDGAHADYEHVEVADLARRVTLYGRLLEAL